MLFLNFLSWFTMPRLDDHSYDGGISTTTGMLSGFFDYSAEFFTSLSGIIIGLAVGIPIAIVALKWLIGLVRGNTSHLFYDKKMTRFRRRQANPFTWNEQFWKKGTPRNNSWPQ